jgi:Cation transport ATPase
VIGLSNKVLSTREFENISLKDAFELLGSGLNGLSDEEAERRLSIHGRNVIEEKKESSMLEFLRRFWGPMPWLLEIAILLSLYIGHVVEAAIIALLLIINGIMGFFT